MGLALLGMSIGVAVGPYAALVSSGMGVSLLVMGILLVVCPVVGEVGSRMDLKLMLLVYLVAVFAALVTFVVAGSMLAFDDGQYDVRFSALWCDYKGEAKQGETRNDCCGYNCPLDRPAGGKGCNAVNFSALATSPFTCSAALDGMSNEEVRMEGKEVCDGENKVMGVIGCKTVALESATSTSVPMGITAFIFGIALIVGLSTACYLLCRRSGKGAILTQYSNFKKMTATPPTSTSTSTSTATATATTKSHPYQPLSVPKEFFTDSSSVKPTAIAPSAEHDEEGGGGGD